MIVLRKPTTRAVAALTCGLALAAVAAMLSPAFAEKLELLFCQGR